MNKPFVFVGSGLGYLWLLIWIDVGFLLLLWACFPMGLFSAAALDLCYTYVEGRRLRFDRHRLGFFFQWLGQLCF